MSYKSFWGNDSRKQVETRPHASDAEKKSQPLRDNLQGTILNYIKKIEQVSQVSSDPEYLEKAKKFLEKFHEYLHEVNNNKDTSKIVELALPKELINKAPSNASEPKKELNTDHGNKSFFNSEQGANKNNPEEKQNEQSNTQSYVNKLG
jgi:hypothetical protein